jgi:hypothetical protein
MKQKILILTIALMLSVIVAGTCYSFSINLTTPNEALPVMTYATVNGIVDGIDNSLFHFKVDLAPGLSSILDGNGVHFGMDQFFFNTDLDLTASMFKNWDPERWRFTENRNADGFGRFDIKLADPTRYIRETHLYFDIDYTSAVTEADFFLLSDGRAGNGKGHFAAHIAGFDYDKRRWWDIGSTFVRDDGSINRVPDPSTLLLLGTGLVGLGLYGRKKHKK